MQRPPTFGIPRLMALISVLAAGTIPMLAAPAPAKPKAERVLMDEMTMTEVRDAIASGKTTVLLFNGSTEQTGRTSCWGSTFSRRAIWASGWRGSWATRWSRR